MSRTAVVLFNLGGPDDLESVEPFLFNLFSDPAILTLGQPVRWALARFLARRRTPPAREIYRALGGSSPLLANTQAQAQALANALAHVGDVRIFIAMRYWEPRAAETARAVKEFDPENVVLLPLYPQFSTTTSGTSLREWADAAERIGLAARSRTVCCHPTQTGFIGAMAALAAPAVRRAAASGPTRLLYSAHGLPERVVRAGDPYQWQVESTAAALNAAIAPLIEDVADVDWRIAYQSRATPEPWLRPDTEEEVRRAGAEGRAVVVVPVAFVSEHSETLYELDVEYARAAKQAGVPRYERVPAVATAPQFIGGLAELVRRALLSDAAVCSQFNGRLCPAGFRACPNTTRR